MTENPVGFVPLGKVSAGSYIETTILAIFTCLPACQGEACKNCVQLRSTQKAMETLLEQQRRIHEERERLERAMVDEILHKKQIVRTRCILIHNFVWDRSIKCSYDPRSYERNFSNCVEKPGKFSTSTGFEPLTSRYRSYSV